MTRYSITETAKDFRAEVLPRTKGVTLTPISRYTHFILWDGTKRLDSFLSRALAEEYLAGLQLEEWWKDEQQALLSD